MNRILRYFSLITFGAVLATALHFLIDLNGDSQAENKAALSARQATIEEKQQDAAMPKIAAKKLFPVSATDGWRVEIYSQTDGALREDAHKLQGNENGSRTGHQATDLLGSFMHTGSWVDLAEFRKHDGIFVAAPVTIAVRGYIYAASDDDFVFAMHFQNRGATKAGEAGSEASKTSWIRCKADVALNGMQKVIGSRARFDTHAAKAELRSAKPISLKGPGWHLVEASIACSLPPKIDPADIAFRICARRSADRGFSPLRPVMPLAEARRTPSVESRI